MNRIASLIFIAAAVLEVSGDGLIRKGPRSKSLAYIIVGAVALGFYGVVVNRVKWDFSKLLGVYVASSRGEHRVRSRGVQRACAQLNVVGLSTHHCRWSGDSIWSEVKVSQALIVL